MHTSTKTKPVKSTFASSTSNNINSVSSDSIKSGKSSHDKRSQLRIMHEIIQGSLQMLQELLNQRTKQHLSKLVKSISASLTSR